MAGIIGIHGDHSCEGQGGECGLHLVFPEVAFERVQGSLEIGGFGAELLHGGITPEEVDDAPVQAFLKRGEGIERGVGEINHRLRRHRLLSAAFAAAGG